MNTSTPSTRARGVATGAFFLSILMFLVALVLDQLEPRPGTQYLLAFGAAAVLVTLLVLAMVDVTPSVRATNNAGAAFFLFVLMFVIVLVLDHVEPRPETSYVLAFGAAAVAATLLLWGWMARRAPKRPNR